MPETLTAPPANTPPPSTQPAQAAKTTIAVSGMPAPVEPIKSKPGSAMDRMREELRKKAGDGSMSTRPTPKQDPVNPEPKVQDPKVAEEPKITAPEETEPAKTVDDKSSDKGKKVNPWKLVEEYKAKLATMEKQNAEKSAAIVPEQERKAIQEAREKAEARAKELEEEIRFVNYEKSSEFKDKYDAPYNKAWTNATKELGEITVDDGNGGQRPATAQDLLAIVNQPLGRARELADQLFGNFADDAMAHRKEIKNLFEQRQQALEDAKKNGAEREKKTFEERAKQQAQINAKTTEYWDKFNKEAQSDPEHGKYFTPLEGDQEGNQRLAKGFELANRAFRESPLDPNISEEERQARVKRHAAVLNRAAAYGRQKLWIQQRDVEIAELKAKLKQYEENEPGTVGDNKQPTTPTHTSAKASIFAELRKRAK